MNKKKRHHYVPRFYLKRFSVNNDNKTIGLYNHQNNVFVKKATLRHQAYRNFLYGEDDEIENALAGLEGKVSMMFNYWTEEKLFYPPPVESNAFKLLRQFILYQANRTPKSGNEMLQSINAMVKKFVREINPDLSKQLENGIITFDNPELLNLLNAAQYEHLLGYLDCRFIVNLSELSLITSDAPVIFYNQFMELAGNYNGATAAVSKGLQIFYPIHPRLIICLYDPIVYDLGNNCINCCSTESIEEIHQLNGLQFINSDTQLFFDDTITEEYVKALCSEYSKYRKEPIYINEIVKYDSKKFLYSTSKTCTIGLKLNLFKMLMNPKEYANILTPVRHSSFVRPS